MSRSLTKPPVALLAVTLALTACGAGLQPAELAAGDACSACRMTVTDGRTAGQVVTSGEDPLFFDDLGCLRDYLGAHQLPADARVYVADHRTGEWVAADAAVFARVSSVDTPMGSHVLAWRDDSSRSTDPAAEGAQPLARAAVLGRSNGGTQ